MNEPFDLEFKLYLHANGINVDSNIFDIKFNPPQNFASYRQSEMDTARVNTFNTMIALPQISKRFAMERFLGLTREEIAQNQSMWQEENIDTGTTLNASSELRGAGITANGIAGDISGLSTPPSPEEGESGPSGAEGAPGESPAAPQASAPA